MAPRTATPRLDAVSANAVDLARTALEAVTLPGQVGEHERVIASGDRLVTHVFACTMPGYRGWSWVVVLARAPRAKAPTVSETALLPGEDAVLAPAWEPWSERLRPSDVGPDDLLPYLDTDPRLEQGYEQTDDAEADRATPWELGLGRKRVLSPLGRTEAADRWQEGEFGTRAEGERRRKAPADDTAGQDCGNCGFLTLLAGSLRQEFGVCTNEWSPADGRVVALNYRCGAHSETGHEEAPEHDPGQGVVLDELGIDYLEQVPVAAPSAEAETPSDAVDGAEAPAEELQPSQV